MMQSIVMWGQQPVVCMSAKGDLVEGTIRKRGARGPVYLLDLSDEVRESELRGVKVQRVISDPCTLVTNDDEAKMMADLLLFAADDGKPGNSDGDIWKKNAARPLAAFLRAGGMIPNVETKELIDGGGINWVLDALDDLDGEADVESPNWNNAILRTKSMLKSRHAGVLRAVKNMDARQRDSVTINIRQALDPWTLSTVAGGEDTVPFRMGMLEEPGATLYIVSPSDGSAAGAATAVINQCIQYWRRNIDRNLPTLGLFLDEVAQSARIPKLPEFIAVLRGYNIRLIAAVQTVIQLKRRWGDDGMEEMLRTFPSVLIMPSTPDREVFELASWFAGEEERTTTSVDESGRTTRSKDRMEVITASELVPRKKGTARLLIGGAPGPLVSIPDVSETNILD